MTLKKRMDNENRPEISHEMIAPQKNDPVIKELNEAYGDLWRHMDNNNYGKFELSRLFNHPEAKVILKRIEDIYHKRFGLNARFLENNSMPAAIYVTYGPQATNVLAEKHNDMVKSELDTAKKYVDKEKKSGAILDKDLFNRDPNSGEKLTKTEIGKLVVKQIYDNNNALRKVYNEKGVIVDNKNARIYGLPDNCVVMIICDFICLHKTMNLTPEEASAVIMHEIGHAYTWISLEYKTVRTTHMLYENLIDCLSKKGMTVRDACLHTMKEIDPGSSKDIEAIKGSEHSGEIAVIELTKKVAYHTLSSGIFTATDSENLADAFAVAMGVGGELASGLVKIKDNLTALVYEKFINPLACFKRDDEPTEYLNSMNTTWTVVGFLFRLKIFFSIVSSIMSLLFMLVGGSASIAIKLGFVLIAQLEVANLVSSKVTSILGMSDGKDYDNDKNRFARIRQNMIRNLRTLDLPKEEKFTLISKIEETNKYVEMQANTISGLVDDGIEIVQKLVSKNFRLQAYEEAIERLQNNELHVSGNKLAKALGVEHLTIEELKEYISNINIDEIY